MRWLVHAEALVSWLQVMGETPSRHLVNWATATARPRLAVVPPSPFPLKTFSALVAHRAAHRGSSWADGDQREIARIEFERRSGAQHGRKTKVKDELAEELGTTRQPFERTVWGERKRAQSPATVGSSEPMAAATLFRSRKA